MQRSLLQLAEIGSCMMLVLYRKRTAQQFRLARPQEFAFDTAVRRKPLAIATDAGRPMGFQSIFAWKALPEAAFTKNVIVDFLSIFPLDKQKREHHPRGAAPTMQQSC
jgi:hypothetical protein